MQLPALSLLRKRLLLRVGPSYLTQPSHLLSRILYSDMVDFFQLFVHCLSIILLQQICTTQTSPINGGLHFSFGNLVCVREHVLRSSIFWAKSENLFSFDYHWVFVFPDGLGETSSFTFLCTSSDLLLSEACRPSFLCEERFPF